ncbi:hypothetical protein LINGRAHAP2_LOCUS33710 [Linum grandiflorum]
MADSTLKRQREVSDETESKRYKPYNDNNNSILSSFIDQEEEPIQDLSSFLSSIQEELSSPVLAPENHDSSSSSTTVEDYDYEYASSSSNVEEEERERVIRHLLEASDDELGIPTADNGEVGLPPPAEVAAEEGDGFGINYDGLWEFEDLNANYYTLLQSELFM